jgi:hypothetical protein
MSHGLTIVKLLIANFAGKDILVGSTGEQDSAIDTLEIHYHADQFGLIPYKVFPVQCCQHQASGEFIEEMVDEANIILALDSGVV